MSNSSVLTRSHSSAEQFDFAKEMGSIHDRVAKAKGMANAGSTTADTNIPYFMLCFVTSGESG